MKAELSQKILWNNLQSLWKILILHYVQQGEAPEMWLK